MTPTPKPTPPALDPRGSLLLDLLRLAAAQAVLLGHSFDFFDWHSSLGDPSHAQIQRLGVAVFFVLSGFLIPYSVAQRRAASTDDTSAYRFCDFAIDRISRIYCALLPALLVIACFDALPLHQFETRFPAAVPNTGWAVAAANALHLQEYPVFDWLGSPVPMFGSGDPLWSLAVEWWIYVLFGLYIFRQRRPWALALASIAAISVTHNLVGGTGDRIVLAWIAGWAAFGCWRRWALKRLPLARSQLAMLAALLAALSIATVWVAPQRSHFALDIPFVVLGSAAMTVALLALPIRASTDQRSKPTTRWGRAIHWAANFSFTLYLTHFSVLTVLYEFRTHVAPAAAVVIAFVTCNAVAYCVAWMGERHTRSVRHWLKAV